ncbi:PIR Superfamily Protein [Plasmodium ovale wallikeri]|uniref:PIR Superfamily Protein n=1 Tax=Plasmodium ovale wallikeri TaxID=864142 RepID=A0A1A9AQE3_PLAOA|nr:PIR Superfamily Protein [Plasmodium ovale wallikeri]
MADSYEYEHVKNFLSYKSILESFGHDFSVDPTNDPIITKCRKNVSAEVVQRFFFTDLCIKINKYLKHFSDLKENIHEHCEYLNYYLNGKYKNNKDVLLYKNALDPNDPWNIFDDTISNVSKYKSKIYNLEEDVFDKIDTLYKLIEQYIFFITRTKQPDMRDHFCKYAEGFANLYNTAIDECYNEYDNKYCRELKEYRNKYITQEKFIKTCKNVQSLKPSPESNSSEVSANTGDLSTVVNDSYSASDIGVLVGKILGGCLASLLVYKFTPLKSLLPFRKQKKKTDWDNIDYEAHGYYSPNYEHEQTFEDTGQYNVQYYSRYDFE